MLTLTEHEKIALAREYFIRSDLGRSDVLDLLHDDVEIYYPKFGLRVGPEALFELVKPFAGSLEYIRHDYDTLKFIPSGDYLVVEGTSKGKLSGTEWSGGRTAGGRFCNVFKFRGGRISSLHIYLDPDYTGEDEARFRWGKNRTW